MSNLDTLLLSEEQHQRYLKLLAEKGLGHSGIKSIPRRAPGSRVPLCSYQEPLWFIDRFTDGDTAHNVVYPMGLPEGDIDEEALVNAIARMMARQEILRTTFAQDDEGGIQVLHDSLPLMFDRVDLTSLPAEQREAAGWKLVDEEAAFRFDLDTGPLIKFTLLIAAPGKHVLIFSLHHIVCDTWSVGIIDREVRTHYDDIVKGKPWTLPPVQVQFSDYSVWQKSALGRGAYESHLDYWIKRLSDAPQLQLPTDFAIPEERSHPALNSLVYIDEALLAKARAFAKSEGVTLYMVLLTAFKIMLVRHSGQHDIVVGTPHANREHELMRDLIGFTINSLVLRTDLGGEPDFRTALARVKTTALEAHEHQDVPFQSLAEALGPRKGAFLSRYSLFRAFFSVQNINWSDMELPQINTGTLHSKPRFTVPHPTTKYDVYMYLRERDGKVLGGLEYDAELFKLPRIERMIRNFLSILAQGVSHPGTSIHALNMLGDEDLQAPAVPSAAPSAPRTDIYKAFEQAVERHRHRPAVIDGTRTLSYGELNEAAASFSAAPGLGDLTGGTRVGLLMDRSWRMVVALLAVLRQGGVCVALDHSAPEERTATTVLAYDIAKLISSEPARLIEDLQQRCIPLAAIEGMPAHAPARKIDPAQAAFVFMTSGSTGVPNAVELSHAGVLDGQLPESCPHPIGVGDRLLLSTPTSSARLVGELLWPLLGGASVVLCGPNGHQDPEYLGAMLEQHGITHFSVLPQVLTALLDSQALTRCPSLKLVYCVGQNLGQDLVDRFAQQSAAALYNTYAQTEVCPVTFEPCLAGQAAGLVPVGKPAPHATVHVLDERLQLVPIDVTGQVAVGGAGLAMGYFGNPRLTAEKFVPNPFGRHGARLYLSGDLGRWNEQRSLVLSGRADRRVKIRGYRIDLGDIESALLRLSGVCEAAALVHGHQQQEPSIVAFVRRGSAPLEPAGGLRHWVSGLTGRAKPGAPSMTVAEMRVALQHKLPHFMQPSRIVEVQEMPLGRTGKLNPLALLDCLPPAEPETSSNSAARNEIERTLLSIWREVLKLPESKPLGIHDSFFEVGGHSLLAITIVKRVQARMKVKLDIRQVFESVTIAGLAELIEWKSYDEVTDDSLADKR